MQYMNTQTQKLNIHVGAYPRPKTSVTILCDFWVLCLDISSTAQADKELHAVYIVHCAQRLRI